MAAIDQVEFEMRTPAGERLSGMVSVLEWGDGKR